MNDIPHSRAIHLVCPLSLNGDEEKLCGGVRCMAWLRTSPGNGICQMVHFAPFVEVTSEKCGGKCGHGE